MDIVNTSGTACSECSTISALDRLADALDKLGVEYTIEQHAA
ncbi:Uncharacterised protein [Mycobacteroides abscessus subsp. abscessus]|nr:hypothetical protein [Mycobacteroides abscessus]MDB2220690.1 hypothetical protein [Mycobacteroides abscessus subsp. abscessus]CPR84403.1 Uncharacterised protein [Mycobacteroides abscessus]SHT05444.1 Uncharacterised protein [Mycobacteroides abscessus subsp. abscessus]SID01016.1 Uncharacterised protein [Mycobacteroides abscessus subsp. abscessus]SIL38487.1 Uncharacterised protein [Mycobacteroides abscessus subsp. abscessus]